MSDCIESTWKYRLPAGYAMSGGRLAHRKALMDLHVPIAGMIVRHLCDNPPCINPDHLAVGTQADNLADMHEKHRWPTVLNDRKVWIIKRLDELGWRKTVIGQVVGTSDANVRQVTSGKTWRHVT